MDLQNAASTILRTNKIDKFKQKVNAINILTFSLYNTKMYIKNICYMSSEKKYRLGRVSINFFDEFLVIRIDYEISQ